MKKILFLLLSTIAMYGQVPADATPLENIQITNNTQSTTATKVNVQETDGTINTISKSDLVNVVEVNDVPSLPITGVAGKIYVVSNVNKIYRWNGTFYQELAGSDISGKEDIANKQNSLSVDGSNTKYPTVTAVNTGLGLKENILNNPITGVGSQNNANTYALQDGTILYHSAKWFIPTSTVSTSGTTVTSVDTQFTSAMVGAKLIINGEWRIITAYAHAKNVTVASAYSANYSGVVAENWGVYSRCSSITSTGHVNYYSYQGMVMFAYIPSDQFNVRFSGFSITGNEVAIQPGGALLRDSAKIFWSNNATYYGTKDLGLRRNNAGVLEIYDGITATGLEANRRDLLARNLFGSKVLIGSIVDDNVNQGQYTGTVSSGTTALNNTPPTANNQLTRKDYVDTGLAGKEPSFTKNTAFNKNFGTTAGTVAQGNDSRILNGQTAFGWGNHASAGYTLTTGSNIIQSSFRTALGLGSNAYTSTAYLPLASGTLTNPLSISVSSGDAITNYIMTGVKAWDVGTRNDGIFTIGDGADRVINVLQTNSNVGIGNTAPSEKLDVTGNGKFSGTVAASPATLSNHVVVKSQLDSFVPSGTVNLTGNQTISGQKSFSLTGKIDMQTNNVFPAIIATSIGSNGGSAAEFINNSSFPYSNALRLYTGSSGGVGNRTLGVLNTSPIGTGIVSEASNGGVSISSQSGNGDSYVSNITEGGTGRNYVGRNNGTETYSVDKTGKVTATSYTATSLPVFENNAAASSLAVGQFYRTSTGVLMVKF